MKFLVTNMHKYDDVFGPISGFEQTPPPAWLEPIVQDPRPSWDTLYMSMCYLMATRSPDKMTKVGSVITTVDNVHVCSGYNGYPRGMEGGEVPQTRPEKYFYFEHAERNAIYNGSRLGMRMDLAHTLYVTWVPCADCARAIIQTGVKEVVIHEQGQQAYNDAKGGGVWSDSQDAAHDMFAASRVKLKIYSGPIIGGLQGFYNGQVYTFSESGFRHEPDATYCKLI